MKQQNQTGSETKNQANARLTDSVRNAQADARAQGGQSSPYMPYLPASSSPHVPGGIDPKKLVWAETVAPGGYSHKVVARGTHIRFDDPNGLACANLTLFNAIQPNERLNVADTQKIPWQAYLGPGHPLLSGDGRILAYLSETNTTNHDALCGYSSDKSNQEKYGAYKPESSSPSGQSLIIKAAAKNNLTLRDLPPSINLFKGVRVQKDGTLKYQATPTPGGHVTLIAEMPLIILVLNTAHPLAPATGGYQVGPLRIHAYKGQPSTDADAHTTRSPEIERAYLNTFDYCNAQGI